MSQNVVSWQRWENRQWSDTLKNKLKPRLVYVCRMACLYSSYHVNTKMLWKNYKIYVVESTRKIRFLPVYFFLPSLCYCAAAHTVSSPPSCLLLSQAEVYIFMHVIPIFAIHVHVMWTHVKCSLTRLRMLFLSVALLRGRAIKIRTFELLLCLHAAALKCDFRASQISRSKFHHVPPKENTNVR